MLVFPHFVVVVVVLKTPQGGPYGIDNKDKFGGLVRCVIFGSIVVESSAQKEKM